MFTLQGFSSIIIIISSYTSSHLVQSITQNLGYTGTCCLKQPSMVYDLRSTLHAPWSSCLQYHRPSVCPRRISDGLARRRRGRQPKTHPVPILRAQYPITDLPTSPSPVVSMLLCRPISPRFKVQSSEVEPAGEHGPQLQVEQPLYPMTDARYDLTRKARLHVKYSPGLIDDLDCRLLWCCCCVVTASPT